MRLEFHALLRSIVRAGSPQGVAQTITGRIAASRSIVLVRAWVVTDGQLVLASSAGTPSGGGSYSRLDGEFREMAIADRTIQEIADSRRPFVVDGVRGDEDWLTNSAWTARQGVRSFVALPLVADDGDQAVGVFAFFDRELADDRLIFELQVVAEIAAVRVAELGVRVSPPAAATAVVTRSELRQIEKKSIEAALAKSGGRIFGTTGAAVLLGMRPTTLASRIKALGVSRR
jgi:transcriptional regulator with GAF, ATPase, and Fis domain